MTDGINVLSLFDGMSCGMLALERAGIKVKNYYASEIDKYAIQVSKKNYPQIQNIGDVTKVGKFMLFADGWRAMPEIDLLIGGSPCQGFSFAGKQLNFEDPRSKLFFEYVRILKEVKPKYFLLENVVMKKEYQDIISEQLGVQPIMINSALVSAQNRKRLYWTNIPGVEQPQDKGILLKDIIEYDNSDIEDFKNCVRKNIIGVNINKYIKPNGFAQISSESGFQDHKIGITKTPTIRAGNSFCLLATPSGGVRRITPIECERLQTLPDNYTEGVSNSQRYKMIGNGWTVDVIAHILSFYSGYNIL